MKRLFLALFSLPLLHGCNALSKAPEEELPSAREVAELVAESYPMDEKVVVTGDFNVTFDDRDIAEPDLWRDKILCSEPERAAMAKIMKVDTDDCFLFESGMAAIFTLFRIVTEREPGKKTLQLSFPYVDTLKVQQLFGSGADLVSDAQGEQLQATLAAIRSGEYAAVFCEVPSNPLLNTVDLHAVSEACRAAGTPLLVDDTVCSHLNIDALPLADAVSTSLTKWVSGIGDVMAGSVKLNRNSSFSSELRGALLAQTPGGSRLYQRDAEVLASARGGTTAGREAPHSS